MPKTRKKDVYRVSEIVRRVFEIVRRVSEIVRRVFEIVRRVSEIVRRVFEIVQWQYKMYGVLLPGLRNRLPGL